MNTTHLRLIFFDNPDPKTLYLQDVSLYNPDIIPELPTFVLTPPNFSTSYTLFYPVNSLIPINSNAFGWTNTNDPNQLQNLQDGIWIIEQSIKPNGVIKKQHLHFRITKLKTQLIKYVSDKMDSDSPYFNPNDPWYNQMFNFLQILETAKQLAEICGKCEEATIMYNQVELQSAQYVNPC